MDNKKADREKTKRGRRIDKHPIVGIVERQGSVTAQAASIQRGFFSFVCGKGGNAIQFVRDYDKDISKKIEGASGTIGKTVVIRIKNQATNKIQAQKKLKP